MRKGGFSNECQFKNEKNWPNEKYDQEFVENEGSSEVFDGKANQGI